MKTKKKNRKSTRLSKSRPIRHAKTVFRITPKFVHGMVIGSVVGLVVVATLRFVSPAYADSYTPGCVVNAVTLSNGVGIYKSFVVDGNTVTSTISVSGPSDCRAAVSLASWKAPYGSTNFLPIAQQTLFDSETDVFAPGQHTMSVKIFNDCYYQVDLLRGSSPKASDGTPNYAYGQLADYIQAGNTVCEPPATPPVTTTTAPTPPPATPGSSVTPVTPTLAQPPTLVNTGPGSAIIVGVLAAIGGYIFHMAHRHLKHKRRLAHHRI